MAWLQGLGLLTGLRAVGQRVVHGGSHYTAPALLTELRSLNALDTEHMPQTLGVIQSIQQAFRTIPQVACFDTAFHRRMPRVTQILPLPRDFWEDGVVRYGFHGLSYEYIVQELHQARSRRCRRPGDRSPSRQWFEHGRD